MVGVSARPLASCPSSGPYPDLIERDASRSTRPPEAFRRVAEADPIRTPESAPAPSGGD